MEILLVQISDLHFGAFKKESFERAVDEINDLHPDVVVVTGDVTDEGLLEQYEEAERGLDKIEVGRLIMCSGNHDYRNTGYLLFKKLFSEERVCEVGDLIIVTLGTARPDRDEGEVGHRQNLWLQEVLSKYQDRRRIVAMHHHLIPVPDTGADRITVLDAGDILKTILHSKVDLILCGHRHRPWKWSLGDLTIVHAGTLSSPRTRGLFANTYNIINIDQDRLNIELKIVGGEKISLDRIVEEKEPLEEPDLEGVYR